MNWNHRNDSISEMEQRGLNAAGSVVGLVSVIRTLISLVVAGHFDELVCCAQWIEETLNHSAYLSALSNAMADEDCEEITLDDYRKKNNDRLEIYWLKGVVREGDYNTMGRRRTIYALSDVHIENSALVYGEVGNEDLVRRAGLD